jgi:O-antigen ligase
VVQLKWYSALAWFALFIAFTAFIPQLNHLLAQLSNVEVTQTRDAVARATGDMSRLAIWQQMLHAIAERPWFGYGWHQTSVAYTLISDQFQGPVWVKSAHNFILDFMCGMD